MLRYTSKNYYVSQLVSPYGFYTGTLTPSGYNFTLDNLHVVTENSYTGYIKVTLICSGNSTLNREIMYGFTGTSGYFADMAIKGNFRDTVFVETISGMTGQIDYRAGFDLERAKHQ